MLKEEEAQQIKAKLKEVTNRLSEHCEACVILVAVEAESMDESVDDWNFFYGRRGGRYASIGLTKDFERWGPHNMGGPDVRFQAQLALSAMQEVSDCVVVLVGVIREDTGGVVRCFMYHGNWWEALGMCEEFRHTKLHERNSEVDEE